MKGLRLSVVKDLGQALLKARGIAVLTVLTLLSLGLSLTGSPLEWGASRAAAASLSPSYLGGVAEAELIVSPGTVLGGYGVYLPPVTPRARRSSGSVGPLKVTAFAVQGMRAQITVVVGIDAVGLRFSTIDRIRAAVQAWHPEVNLIINASHSHSTPDSFGLWGDLTKGSGVDPAYLEQLEQKTIGVVRAAVTGMRPVVLTWSSAPRSTWNVDGEAPNEMTWIWMSDRRTGATLGSLTHWNAHPTVLPAANTLASADYVGFYRAFLDQSVGGGAVHTFVNGYLAGVYPILEGEEDLPFSVPRETQESWDPKVLKAMRHASGLGHAMAEDALRGRLDAVEIKDRSSFVESFTTWVPVTNTLFRILMRIGAIENVAPQGKLRTPLQWFRLGPIEAVAIPGEPSPAVAQQFLDHMSASGVEHPLVFGQSGGMVGYLLDPETEHGEARWKYQTSVSPSAQAAANLVRRFQEIFWH